MKRVLLKKLSEATTLLFNPVFKHDFMRGMLNTSFGSFQTSGVES